MLHPKIQEAIDEFAIANQVLGERGTSSDQATLAAAKEKLLAAIVEYTTVKVQIDTINTTRGPEYFVAFYHPCRPEDADPWDTLGRITPHKFENREHAELEAQIYTEFFAYRDTSIAKLLAKAHEAKQLAIQVASKPVASKD